MEGGVGVIIISFSLLFLNIHLKLVSYFIDGNETTAAITSFAMARRIQAFLAWFEKAAVHATIERFHMFNNRLCFFLSFTSHPLPEFYERPARADSLAHQAATCTLARL